jgi:hypothetical protein
MEFSYARKVMLCGRFLSSGNCQENFREYVRTSQGAGPPTWYEWAAPPLNAGLLRAKERVEGERVVLRRGNLFLDQCAEDANPHRVKRHATKATFWCRSRKTKPPHSHECGGFTSASRLERKPSAELHLAGLIGLR